MAGNGSCRWSNLPSELIHLISTKVPDLSDRARVRAICKTWQSSVSLLDPSPRLPWFLSCDMDKNEKILCYSLSSKKTYKIHCPQLRDAYLSGTAGSFILCGQNSGCQSLSLFNPLTGLEISLPYLEDFAVVGVVSNLLQEDVVVVSGITEDTDEIWVGLIRPGDESWATHNWDMDFNEGVSIYYDGLYYVNKYNIPTSIMNATTGEVVTTVSPPDTGSRLISFQNILEMSGEILLIYRHKTTGKLEDIGFDIYRLDQVTKNYQWVKIRGVGDRMLFLDGIRGFSLSASEFPGFRGNCIYFQLGDDLDREKCLLCRHDLENGTTEALPNFGGMWGTWIIPKFT